MQVQMKPGHKFRKKHTDEEGFVHFEVVDKSGAVVYQGFANTDASIDLRNEDGTGVVGTVDELDNTETPPNNRIRMSGDPRQNPRV